MPTILPPVPVQTDHEPPHSRIDFRVRQIVLSIATVAAVCWLWQINPEFPVLGIAGAFLAKHVLVAILASGLSFPPIREEGKSDKSI